MSNTFYINPIKKRTLFQVCLKIYKFFSYSPSLKVMDYNFLMVLTGEQTFLIVVTPAKF